MIEPSVAASGETSAAPAAADLKAALNDPLPTIRFWGALAALRPFARTLLARELQDARAHHRRRRQGNSQRNQNGNRQRHGKFAKQAADDAAHEQDRDEDGDQRKAHRDDGEADLARAAQAYVRDGVPLNTSISSTNTC